MSQTGPRTTTEGTGYTSRAYAEAFSHEGPLVRLASSGTWAVRRRIPAEEALHDVVGSYPILCCDSWSGLTRDLTELRRSGAVSFVAVIDPLADVHQQVLQESFPDLLRPFKPHFVVDLLRYRDEGPSSKHHRRYVATAQRGCSIVQLEASSSTADEVVRLYDELRNKHQVTGRADFPRSSLEAQLATPGMTVFAARADDEFVAFSMWLQMEDRVYYHLGASSPTGYEQRASFALFDEAFRHFAGSARSASLGGGAGTGRPDDADGLVRFKRGWGTSEVTAWLGGSILDHAAYDRLSGGVERTAGYFPAYRG